MFIPYNVENDEGLSGIPWSVWIIGLINVAVHLILFLGCGELIRIRTFYRFGCIPDDFELYSLVTCMFLHGGWGHIIGNMLFFYVYGTYLERKIGWKRFLPLYFGGGILSGIIHVISVPELFRDVPAIGASGAISAILGAFLVIMPHVKINTVITTFVRPIPVTVPAWTVLGFWFIGQLLFSLKITTSDSSVAFWAHIGGFAAGACFGTVFQYFDRKRIDRFSDMCRAQVVEYGIARLNEEDVEYPLDMTDELLLRTYNRFSPVYCKMFFEQNLDKFIMGMLDQHKEARSMMNDPKSAATALKIISDGMEHRLTHNQLIGAARAAFRSHANELSLYFHTKLLYDYRLSTDSGRFLAQLAETLRRLGHVQHADAVVTLRSELFPNADFYVETDTEDEVL